MKRLLFYCQHILGMGHLVRSMEIVRGLVNDFEVCFINGGEIVDGFQVPPQVEIVNLPAIKTDSEFKTLQVVDESYTLAEVQEIRKQKLLDVCDRLQPDVLMIELFPFGRGKFSFELIPLLEQAKSLKAPTKTVCSLRDIVVTKRDQAKYEDKVCRLMNQHFDLLLVHGDPQFQPLEASFAKTSALRCPLHYTGYVVQPQPNEALTPVQLGLNADKPLILASVGGGRFGHELLDCVIKTAPLLAQHLPHQIQIFTGPFMPDDKFAELQAMAAHCDNVRCDRYTPHLLSYLRYADLSISMSGYNTTMNILTTGTRAMLLPFTGNEDQEQTIRAQKLAELGAVETIVAEDFEPARFAQKVMACLRKQPTSLRFNFDGVETTARLLNHLVAQQTAAQLTAQA
jgi:predicted glycosyltransferase